MTVELIANLLIPAVVGALTAGIPLYIKLRSANFDLRKQESELQDKTKINTEGEWKRILEYRDRETIELKAKDEAQEKRIDELYNLHIKCETDKARYEEKQKSLEAKLQEKINHIEKLEEKLESKFDKLIELLLEQTKNVSKGTPAASVPASGEIRVGPGP